MYLIDLRSQSGGRLNLNDDDESSGSVQVYEAEVPSFLDNGKTLGLKSLHLKLKKNDEDVVKVLVDLLVDPKTEPKLRLQAATTLLEYRVKVADKMSSDAISRLIAEVKLNPTGRKQLTSGGSDPTMPLVDFSTVQKVD